MEEFVSVLEKKNLKGRKGHPVTCHILGHQKTYKPHTKVFHWKALHQAPSYSQNAVGQTSRKLLAKVALNIAAVMEDL